MLTDAGQCIRKPGKEIIAKASALVLIPLHSLIHLDLNTVMKRQSHPCPCLILMPARNSSWDSSLDGSSSSSAERRSASCNQAASTLCCQSSGNAGIKLIRQRNPLRDRQLKKRLADGRHRHARRIGLLGKKITPLTHLPAPNQNAPGLSTGRAWGGKVVQPSWLQRAGKLEACPTIIN